MRQIRTELGLVFFICLWFFRLLQTADNVSDTTSVPVIPNALICLEVCSILWNFLGHDQLVKHIMSTHFRMPGIRATVSRNPDMKGCMLYTRLHYMYIQTGNLLLFGIEINDANRALSNYPVYVVNHLYNTNPTFDYGAFR